MGEAELLEKSDAVEDVDEVGDVDRVDMGTSHSCVR